MPPELDDGGTVMRRSGPGMWEPGRGGWKTPESVMEVSKPPEGGREDEADTKEESEQEEGVRVSVMLGKGRRSGGVGSGFTSGGILYSGGLFFAVIGILLMLPSRDLIDSVGDGELLMRSGAELNLIIGSLLPVKG